MENNRRIEYMPVSELMTRLHPDNPKEHDIPMIAQSFQDHGFVSSGTIDERTGLFLCGHGRTEALQHMIDQQMDTPRDIDVRDGEWYCPVECGYNSLNDAQALAYITIDNQATITGGWDKAKLATLLQQVKDSDDTTLESTGFDESQLEEMRIYLGDDEPDWGDAFEKLPEGDRQPYQQITFTLHDSQIETVKEAITKSKSLGEFDTENKNSNGNAISRICETFIGDNYD